ncbi:MAG: uridine kinase family protein [Christensenellales bacterium]
MKNDNAFALVSYVGDKLKLQEQPIALAIDGRCASGKTTLAAHLHEMFPESTVFHMDDFFLPPELRTQARLNEPGGNVHRERFFKEVLINLSKNEPFSYRKYSCRTDSYSSFNVNPAPLYIIEGAYSMRPEFLKYYDITVFMDISSSLQQYRLSRRETAESLENFINKWIPLEEKYIAFYEPHKKADFLLNAQS